MAKISDLLPDVRPSVIEAAVPEVEDAIRRTLIDFCRESRIWREEIVIDIEPGKSTYRLRPSQGGRVEQVLTAVYSDDKRSNQPIKITEYENLVTRRSPPTSKIPQLFAVEPSSKTARFYPEPNVPLTDNPIVSVFVVAVPQRRSSTFPDFIREEWYEGIVHGALAMLYGMADKPWTNHKLQAREKRDYHIQLNKAHRESSSRNWSRGRAIPRLTY